MSEPEDKAPDMPDEPISTLLQGAIAMHELYQSYVDAGFTRTEALQLVMTLIQTGAQRGKEAP